MTLKDFIKDKYGSNVRMAQALDVTPQVVSNWIVRDPHLCLKHMIQICEQTKCSPRRLHDVVVETEKVIQNGTSIQGSVDTSADLA